MRDEQDRQKAAKALELLDQIAARAGERFDEKHGFGAVAAARRLLRGWLDEDDEHVAPRGSGRNGSDAAVGPRPA
jgi:hypothetical protein